MHKAIYCFKTIQIKQFKLSNHMHLFIDFAKVTIYL